METLTSRLFPAVLDGGFITTSKDCFMVLSLQKPFSHPTCLSNALVPSEPHPSSNWEPSFGLFKPNQHFPWIALSTAGFWCLCLAIYYFSEGMGSLAHWMFPAPGSAVSQEASAVLQSPRPVACPCLSIPFSVFFMFAGQSRGTALFACPGAEQGTFSSGWGLLLLVPQNLGK